MTNQKPSDKTNALLIAFVVVLALVLAAEIFYLFGYKKQTPPTTPVAENAIKEKVPTISNLYKKIPEKEANEVYDRIHDKIDATLAAYKNGVLTELIFTETYKSVVVNIGKTDTTRIFNNKEQKFDFIFQFSTMADEGKKEMGFLLTKEELKKVKAFKVQENEAIPINIEEIKTGDFVMVTIETDLFGNPSNNMVSMEIQKLL